MRGQTEIPALGTSVDTVVAAWRRAGASLGRSGWRNPYAFDVDQSLTFFWGADGSLCVSMAGAGRVPTMRAATTAEQDALFDNLGKGHVEIGRMGTCGPFADRRHDSEVLHQATGATLPPPPSTTAFTVSEAR
jgi:hypothetical protein